jgi:transcriptional regulator of aromatic amino acid metabolism
VIFWKNQTFLINITEIQSGDQERQATFGTKQTKGKTQSRKLKRLFNIQKELHEAFDGLSKFWEQLLNFNICSKNINK